MQLGRFTLLIAMLATLTGCWEHEPIGVPVANYNFSQHDINSVWVNGKWAGLVRVEEGGAQAGWVSLPATYQPGITVTVDWERNACVHGTSECAKRDKDGEIIQVKFRKTVAVQPYDAKDVAELQLAFLPNDEVRGYADGALFSYEKHPSRKEFGGLLAQGMRPLESLWPRAGIKSEASR